MMRVLVASVLAVALACVGCATPAAPGTPEPTATSPADTSSTQEGVSDRTLRIERLKLAMCFGQPPAVSTTYAPGGTTYECHVPGNGYADVMAFDSAIAEESAVLDLKHRFGSAYLIRGDGWAVSTDSSYCAAIAEGAGGTLV